MVVKPKDPFCKIHSCRVSTPGTRGGREIAWPVDHDHYVTEIVVIRGLLCLRCNNALGNVNDDINKLVGLIAYLKNPPAPLVLKRENHESVR